MSDNWCHCLESTLCQLPTQGSCDPGEGCSRGKQYQHAQRLLPFCTGIDCPSQCHPQEGIQAHSNNSKKSLFLSADDSDSWEDWTSSYWSSLAFTSCLCIYLVGNLMFACPGCVCTNPPGGHLDELPCCTCRHWKLHYVLDQISKLKYWSMFRFF